MPAAHADTEINFSKFSLEDLIWIANYSVCKHNRKLAFEAMLKHQNKSVKYIYDLYMTTSDLELKEFARQELKKDENIQILFIVGKNLKAIEEIKK